MYYKKINTQIEISLIKDISKIDTSNNKNEIKKNNTKIENIDNASKNNAKDTNAPDDNKTTNNDNLNKNEVPKEKTIKEKNIDLINYIYNTYGYKVTYGDMEPYYTCSECETLTDDSKANAALNALVEVSKLFPSGFFKNFIGYNGYRVVLYNSIPGAVGVASYEFGDDNRMYLDANQGYVNRTFFHETWHIMDKYIEFKTYYSVNPFDNWNDYNPSGFVYGDSSNNSYTIYDYNGDGMGGYAHDINEISFVSLYAKTSDREDRAELFADLMFRGYKNKYMNSGYGVNEKAKNLALIIRNFFPNSTNAYWERWISW